MARQRQRLKTARRHEHIEKKWVGRDAARMIDVKTRPGGGGDRSACLEEWVAFRLCCFPETIGRGGVSTLGGSHRLSLIVQAGGAEERAGGRVDRLPSVADGWLGFISKTDFLGKTHQSLWKQYRSIPTKCR